MTSTAITVAAEAKYVPIEILPETYTYQRKKNLIHVQNS